MRHGGRTATNEEHVMINCNGAIGYHRGWARARRESDRGRIARRVYLSKRNRAVVRGDRRAV